LGGYFTSVRNFNHNRIACVNINTSIPISSWDPNANNVVYSMVRYQNKIYAGGLFTNIGGQNRTHFAELDTASSSASLWNPAPNNIVHSLFITNDTLLIGGYFSLIEGQQRYRLAEYDLSNHSLNGWAPTFSNTVLHVSSYNGITFIGGIYEEADAVFHPDFAAYYLNLPQSAHEIKKDQGSFTFYPNPSHSSITCNYNLEKSSRVTLKLFDLNGKMKMILLDEKGNAGMNTREVNIEELSSGIYLLRLETEDYISTSKLVKLN